MTSFRWVGFVAATAMACCGGKAVVDPISTGSGGGSSSASSATGPSSTVGAGGAASCDQLATDYEAALAKAEACDACSDFKVNCMVPNPPMTDTCGCPVAVSTHDPLGVQDAVDAWNAWTNAGCTPLPCGEACTTSTSPHCATTQGCVSACLP